MGCRKSDLELDTVVTRVRFTTFAIDAYGSLIQLGAINTWTQPVLAAFGAAVA